MDANSLTHLNPDVLMWIPLFMLMGMILFWRRYRGDNGPQPETRNDRTPKAPERTGPSGDDDDDDDDQRNPPQRLAIWWVILILLLAWHLMGPLFSPSTPDVARVPYSDFLNQVRQDNVSQVGIQGSEILGRLKQPRAWNTRTGELSQPSNSDDTATTTANGTQTDSSTPDNTGNNPAVTDGATNHPPDQSPTAVPKSARPARPRRIKIVEFSTVFPSSLGDPQLLPLLEKHQVEILAMPQTSHWLAGLLGSLLPTALLVGFFWWMGRRAMKQQESIFGAGQPQPRRFNREQAPPVTFDDVAGADAAKLQLQEIVSILRVPERYRALGARIPRGVLLVGPPGTGKTLLARAVAGEARVPFFSISGSEFVEMFVGVGASRVRNLFKTVKATAPAILFVDELDAVGRRRGAGLGQVNDEREQTLNQLLVEMDGFDEKLNVIVLAATNRPDVLDPALRRPGRFDREVVVGLPDLAGRLGILGIHTRRLALEPDVRLDDLAAVSMGMSGAQLANLCNEAALLAARRGHARIGRADFEAAFDRILLGDVRHLTMDTEARRVVAYHESGHALVAWLNPLADPVHKVTIVPHGMALGVTEQRPSEDRYNLSRAYLNARLRVMLGGRVAEETAIGEITTGAENDLIEATRLARRMVTAWGMSELGLAAYESAGEDRFLGYEWGRARPYSEETARRIDLEVERLLTESQQAVRAQLEQARDRLDRLAEALLHRETVDHEALVRLLGPRGVARLETAEAKADPVHG
ncbi:MAG: ATP-dependent zinc metalloprotease FtsH [Candidatus Thiodiazotropha sp.]